MVVTLAYFMRHHRNCLRRLSIQTAVRIGLGICSSFLAMGILRGGPQTHEVNYSGRVEGVIVVTPQMDAAPLVVSTIHEVSNQVGKAVQETESLDLTGFPYVTYGRVRSVNPRGDSLDIEFTLVATGSTPGGILYSGQFEILGGEGRFSYLTDGVQGRVIESPLGSGEITGEADIVESPGGEITVTFRHSFEGGVISPALGPHR